MSSALERARLFRERMAAGKAQQQALSSAAAPQPAAGSAPAPTRSPPSPVSSFGTPARPLPAPSSHTAPGGWPDSYDQRSTTSSSAYSPVQQHQQLADRSSNYSTRNDTVPPSSNHTLQEANSILNLEVSRAAEGAAHQKALLERNQALDQQRALEKKVEDLVQQLEQRNSSAPLTFERCDSAKDGFEVLQLGRGASDKEIVDKYDAMTKSHSHLARMWKGAFISIATSKTSSEVLAPVLRQLGEEEARAHLLSVDLSTLDDAINSAGEPSTGGDLAAEKARSAKLDSKLTSLKRDLDRVTSECSTWKKKAEQMEGTQQPPRKMQVMQADLAKATEDKQALEGKLAETARQLQKGEKELSQLRERAQKWEEERKGLLEARKTAESDAERLKAGTRLEGHRHSPTPSTTSTVSASQTKFVIQKLAAQVKQLSAELAAKSDENAELMMKLCEGGDD